MPKNSPNLVKYVHLQIQKEKKNPADPKQDKYKGNHTVAYHSQTSGNQS